MLEVHSPVPARASQLYSNFQVLGEVICIFDKQKVFLFCFESKRRENKIAAIPRITVEVNRMWEFPPSNTAHGSRLKAKITSLPKLVSVFICA